jgi:endonuclease/exonuclease/phosphatase (EEP) superfamily protein YafD
MVILLQLVLWNANGLSQHSDELKAFLTSRKIDIMLITETHFTQKSYLRISQYTVYHTNHPAGTARGGTAIIIKNHIKHHLLPNFSRDYLQATSVSVEDSLGHLTISSVYLPPKHQVHKEQLEEYYATLGPRFIAGGDYNAKHTNWGSRLITPRGRELLKTIENNHLAHLSTGQPTHWPSDPNKIPDLVDFCIKKGLPPGFATTQSCLDLSSDHSPVLVTLTSQACHHDTQPRLCTKHTNWNYFRYILNQCLTLHIPLKTTNDIDEAAKLFTDSVQCAGWSATPTPPVSNRQSECPILIKKKLAEKRKLRRAWHRLRTPESK